MGVTGEIDHKALKLKELARRNRAYPSCQFRDDKKLIWCCVGCHDIIPDEVAFRGEWCDTCWGVLKLEAGYDD